MTPDIHAGLASADSAVCGEPSFSSAESFIHLLSNWIERGEAAIARVPPLLCVRWHLRMVLEIAKARRDAAGLAAALPHMLSVHDYAKDEQYTSYWQGYGVSPLDLWPNELLVDSQEDRPWIADDVLASAFLCLLPHYGFYGQDKRLIEGTTLKRLIEEVDKALRWGTDNPAVHGVHVSTRDTLEVRFDNNLEKMIKWLGKNVTAQGEWARISTWADAAFNRLPEPLQVMQLFGADPKTWAALERAYSEFQAPKVVTAPTRVRVAGHAGPDRGAGGGAGRGTDRVGPSGNTVQRQAGIGAGGGNGALPDRRAQGGPRAAEPQQEISSDFNDDLDDYQSAEEGSPHTSPDDNLPQAKGPHVHTSVATEVVDLVSGEGDEEPARRPHARPQAAQPRAAQPRASGQGALEKVAAEVLATGLRHKQAQADDDQVQIAGPSHAPQHHTSATKRGATNTAHGPQPAAKRARNDAAAAAARSPRPPAAMLPLLLPASPAAAATDKQQAGPSRGPAHQPRSAADAAASPPARRPLVTKSTKVVKTPRSAGASSGGFTSPDSFANTEPLAAGGAHDGERRKNNPWSNEETETLVYLVELLEGGKGKVSWAQLKIMDSANGHVLKTRDQVACKDKWRNLTKPINAQELKQLRARAQKRIRKQG